MASLSFASTSRVNTVERTNVPHKLIIDTFQEKRLKCQTKHLFMNVVEYFEKEASKSKGLVSRGQTLFLVERYGFQYKCSPSESGRCKQ